MTAAASAGASASEYEPVPLKRMLDGFDDDLDMELGFEIDVSPKRDSSRPMDRGISILQVTIRRPFTVLSLMAIAWSLLPYVVPVFTILSFVRYMAIAIARGQSITGGYSGFLLFYLLLAISGVLLNEKVLKRIIQEPRPPGSASTSYGMPSGHATNCYAWLVWCLLELWTSRAHSEGLTWFLVLLAVMVLGPVPYARVYLQDHTKKQVLVGCLVGSLIGVVAVPARRIFFPLAVPLWLPAN